ncbi:hypothetical protein F5050DRAFT_1713202 [Lentinula boryana]|uniref:Fungal-type protein kinase domain-containing protein n=1 Tax=Lentinula boryana TaxID=40481 RepID=A0ABQ8Q980_9AGAR|nr:hypothetical protein F5050DRAFT_1713202 [Lentinula boryana]
MSVTSTPKRNSTSVHSGDHGSPPVSQQELKETMRPELKGQTWQFDFKLLAKALSAKTRKSSAPPVGPEQVDTLENYDLAIDKLQSQIDKTYKSFARQKPETLLVKSDCPENLKFYVWDRPMKDAKSLKPDGAGVLGFEADELDNLFWSPPAECGEQIAIPVEVKGNWPELVLQAATYARCMFSASPLRQFVPVIGYKHNEHSLRFLVFHRGGCTSSEPLDLDQPKGQKAFIHLLVSILTWRTRADAGFPAWCNDAQICLPRRKAGDSSPLTVDIDRILHYSVCVRGRAPRVFRIRVPASVPGEETLAGKLVPATQTGVRRSTRIQAAKEKAISKTSGTGSPLNPTQTVSGNAKKKAPGQDDDAVSSIVISRVRALADKVENVDQPIDWQPSDPLRLAGGNSAVVKFCWVRGRGPNNVFIEALLLSDCSASLLVGHSLVSAKDLPSLVLAVLHAHTGYYNMCQNDYQHRDLSIGNVLMVDEPIKTERFDIPNPNETQREILELCRKLDINDQCTGFVIDGDMAVTWKSYFTEEHLGTKSGTSEFMSSMLLNPLNKNYMHSPVDDYYSFYFLTQWACAFRDLSPEDKPKDPQHIQQLQSYLAGHVNDREAATTIINDNHLQAEEYGAFSVQAQSFLQKWKSTLVSLDHEALYRDCKFYVWDRPMKDTKRLKPDAAGVLGFEADEPDKLLWSPPAEGGAQIAIPVEVKDNWSDLVLQSGI